MLFARNHTRIIPVIVTFNLSREESDIVQLIVSSAQNLGISAYLVGGFVRDRLLGRKSKDIDVVCVGDGIQLAEEVCDSINPRPHLVIFKRYGTAMITYKDLQIEFVGARKESYSPDSRKPSVMIGTLSDDLHRRDFTINALAVQIGKEDNSEIIDLFDGIADLENKIIRTPLNPTKTYSDDPLRMMRAIRFASQLQFEIEENSKNSIIENAERIRIISFERIIDDLNKIILSPSPSIGFKLLFDTGLLHIIFPEMAALQGVKFVNGQGHKDNFYHTLTVLENVCAHSDGLWLRWSAIMHDIAKPPTRRFDNKVGWTFHGHDGLGAAMVPKIFRKMKLPMGDTMRYVQKLVLLHLRPISLTKENISDSAIRRLIFEAGEDLEDLMTLCRADITSKNPQKVEKYLNNYELVQEKLLEVEEKDRIRNWQPPIDGATIMKTFNIRPSREVGTIKDAIREAILDGDIENNYQSAYDFMIVKGKELGLEIIINQLPRSKPTRYKYGKDI